MKNLANCTPREFLRQTNRIRKKAADWLKLTDIMNIRRACESRKTNLPTITTKSRIE